MIARLTRKHYNMDSDKVRKFMISANRPFSSNDVFSNLQKQGVGKSAVEKALEQMVKENVLYMKLNGKQKVYCVVQPEMTEQDKIEIRSMDEELLQINLVLREVERKCKETEVEVKSLRNTCTMAEAKLKVAEMEETVAQLKSQLDCIKESKHTDVHVSEKDRELVRKNYEKYTKEYRKRKRMCTNILDSIMENCPKTKKALYDEIGIETDESVNMPSL